MGKGDWNWAYMVYEERIEEIDLQRYWLVLKRRWRPASVVFVVTVMAAFGAAATQKPLFEATSKILLHNDQTGSLTGVSKELGTLESLKMTSDPLATQAEIIFSLPILEDTIRALDLKDAEGLPVKPSAIAESLQVNPLAETDVIEVSYRSGQPELSAAVVNQIMRSYIAANIDSNRSEVVAARRFLEHELPQAKADAEQLSEALRRFDEENGIIALPEEAGATVAAIAALDSQISQTQVALVEAQTQSAQLSQQLGMSAQEALSLATVNQSPAVQGALAQLQTLRTELATALTRYTPQHPSVRALQRQESALTQVLSSRVSEAVGNASTPRLLSMSTIDEKLTEELVQAEVKRASTYSQLVALVDARDTYQGRGDVFPGLQQTQEELRNRRDTAQSTYETLRLRLQEIQLAENRSVGSARIVELAVPPETPTVEGQMKYLLAGGVVGAFLGIATAFFLDLIDRTLKTVRDGEKIFGYVLLGVIPYFEMPPGMGQGNEVADYAAEENGMPSRRIVTLGNAYPILSGVYQMLQANLRFISSDKTLKVVAITSSVAGEGKSEVCANLAAAIAQTNRRVLLVDADMRSPSQHHLWNLINAVGLSHVLVGEGSLEKALQPVSHNLTLLSAGVVPPNPMALLDSERMAALINLFREQFDYVIFDTPSLTGSADAAVLGNLADGVLMIMRPRHVSYDRAIAAKSLLERSGATVLGMVANGVDSKNDFGEYSYDARELTDVASHPANAAKERLTEAHRIAGAFTFGLNSVLITVLTATWLLSGGDRVTAQTTGQPTLNALGTQQSTQPPASPSIGLPMATANYSSATYILGAGDQISLSVIGYPEFTGTIAILPDGTLTLPLIGPVRVAGLTPNQLSAGLTQQLRIYLVDPVVNVGLVVMRPVVVTVSGEVHRPGPIQLSSLTSRNGTALGPNETDSTGTNALLLDRPPALPTLSSAVLLAGGVTRDADIRQVVVRRSLGGGSVEEFTLNLWEAVTANAGSADIGLRDGDAIYIPKLTDDAIDRRTVASSSLAPTTVQVKVVGEVVRPGEISVPPNSSISSAVAIAGGPTNDAQLSRVSLVRRTNDGQIEQQAVDLSNLIDDYQVQDGDVVIVAKRGYLSVVDGIGRVLNPLNIFRLFGL
ncbi:MAG: polysaccharide biosynthesis tyrosine autokinase [Phormidesmis sp.]